MKKLSLVLLLLAGTFFTLQAQQSTQDIIRSYLKSEGYTPTTDEDGHIAFKVHGITCYAIAREVGLGCNVVQVTTAFKTEIPYEKLLEKSNAFNRNKFIAKCIVSRSNPENYYSISMEFISDNQANTETQIAYSLQLIPIWVEEFKTMVAEE